MNETATIRQRQLALELRHLRGSRTSAEVRAATGITPTKLSRIESAHVKVRDDDLRTLARFYDVGADRLADLLLQAQEARDSSIAKDFVGYDWDVALRGHLELEAGASRIDTYMIDLVPGLLQTREYTRSLIADRPDVDDDTTEGRLDFRAKRQERVAAGDLTLWTVVDETVLHRLVGGPAVLADQLSALAASPPTVTVQVLPWSAGAHAAIGMPFHLFRFPRYPTIIYRDGIQRGQYVDTADDVAAHDQIMDSVRASALSPRDSRDMLASRAQELRDQ